MSYQVLARKWRPGTFRAMVGQEHVLKALINALDSNRLHHAYLFTGTRGVGKTTIARILAKCLNCETGVSSEPCGKCGACQEITEGRFIDLIEVDAASRTKVEDTRELLENVQYAPTRGRYKIYLIDEVHMLSNHSFNALLKTLEEPPEHVKFLLATTDPQKLPVTILSRCLQFNLKNMSPEKIVEHLKVILDKEVIPFEEAALWLLARAADGSMRDALSLTDQAISFGSEKIIEHDVASMLGAIDHALIEKILGALLASDAATLLKAVEEFSEHAPDYTSALNDLLALLHRIAIAQALPEALDNSLGDRKQVLEYASQLAPEDVQLFYQTALIGRRDIGLASSARAGFEMTLLRMLAFKPQGVVDIPTQSLRETNSSSDAPLQKEGSESEKKSLTDPPSTSSSNTGAAESVANAAAQSEQADEVKTREEIKAQIKAIVGKEGFTAQPKTALTSQASEAINEIKIEPDPDEKSVDVVDHTATVAVGEKIQLSDVPLKLEEMRPDNWIALYQALAIKGILQSTVANCILLGRENNTLYLALDENKSSLFDNNHSARLAALLSDYFGLPINVEVTIQALPDGAETPQQYAERKRREKKAAAIKALMEDPTVQNLKERFGAKLDEDSIQFQQ